MTESIAGMFFFAITAEHKLWSCCWSLNCVKWQLIKWQPLPFEWFDLSPCKMVNAVRPGCFFITKGDVADPFVITPCLTRAPLGYFYNAPHWGGGGAISSPPSDLRNYWAYCKNSSGIWKPWKNCRAQTNFIDLGVTSDVTGQVKVKMFDFSGLVTSASKIAMLSSNKANESAWIMSLTYVNIIYCALWP